MLRQRRQGRLRLEPRLIAHDAESRRSRHEHDQLLARRSPTTSTSQRGPHAAARARAVAAELPGVVAATWARTAASETSTSTCAPRSALTPQGWAQFGHVKMPDYRWGIFLNAGREGPQDPLRRPQGRGRLAGHSWRVPRQPAPHHRHAGRHRAGLGRAAAPPGPDRAEPVRPAQPVPGERGGGPPPVGHGLPAAQVLRPRRPRGRRSAARAPQRQPRQPAHPAGTFNERDTETGWTFFMFTYVHRPRRQVPALRAGRVELRPAGAHLPSSCSPKRRTTCSSASPASSRVIQRTCAAMNELKTDDPARSCAPPA